MSSLFFLQAILLAVATLYAWWKGGMPERAGAAILLAMLVIDRTWHALCGASSFGTLDHFHLALDGVAFVASFLLALFANRTWPLCFAAFQLLSTTGHLLMVIRVDMPQAVYGLLIVAPSYLMILALFAGTALYHRRTRRAAAAAPPF